MKIVIGADHGGVELKSMVTELLRAAGHEVTDVGPSTPESVDYPDYAEPVARRVAAGDADFGILICRTGFGMALAANKIANVRAVNVSDVELARVARRHNDANILCLGADLMDPTRARAVIAAFLETGFEGGRHQRRLEKIQNLEQQPT